MSPPRLVGPRVALEPVPHEVAVAVLAGQGLEAALRRRSLRAAAGWPHDDTPDALRPLAEHGGPGDDGGWLVTIGATVVGECGWRGGPDAWGDAEIGYGLAAPHRGSGLGTEAVGVLAAWVEQQPGVRRVTAEVLAGNTPSRRLLRRLAFHEEPSRPPYVRYVRTPRAPARFAGRHVC